MKMEMKYNTLLEYCQFETLTPDLCYMIMLLPRKKENERNTEKEKLALCQRKPVRNAEELKEALEYFEDFASRYPEIVFRVYISVERKSIQKALFMLQDELNAMVKDMFYENEQVYDRTLNLSSTLKTILCKPGCRAEKLFHFDIDWDNKSVSGASNFMILWKHLEKITKVKYKGYTLNGYTIVTECFNPNDLKEVFPDAKGMFVVKDLVEIKTNSMLYVGVYNHKES